MTIRTFVALDRVRCVNFGENEVVLEAGALTLRISWDELWRRCWGEPKPKPSVFEVEHNLRPFNEAS